MESTVPLEVTLRIEHADLGSLERVVAGALAEVGRALWQHLLSLLEAALPVPLRCPSCDGALKANGRARRRTVTLAGEVELRRRRFRCTTCGREEIPLDAALGLAPRVQHTLGVRELALRLVTELTYGRTARLLDETRGIGVSHGELHRWVAEEGSALEAAREATRESIFGPRPAVSPGGPAGKGTVWVSADGTMVHERGTDSEFEVKLGLVWRGSRPVSRGRRVLRERFLDAGTGSWTRFAESFVASCAALGVYEAEQIYFVSDGAPAIAYIRDHAFPTAIELLDWYHLSEALAGALGADQEAALAECLRVAAAGDVDGLLECLGRAERAAHLDPDGDKRVGKIRKVAGYVAANRRGIENYRIVPWASSGPMEKGVDMVVARRFKLRGMSWRREGLTHLLRLRLLRLNGGWDRYWKERFRAARLPWPVAA